MNSCGPLNHDTCLIWVHATQFGPAVICFNWYSQTVTFSCSLKTARKWVLFHAFFTQEPEHQSCMSAPTTVNTQGGWNKIGHDLSLASDPTGSLIFHNEEGAV